MRNDGVLAEIRRIPKSPLQPKIQKIDQNVIVQEVFRTHLKNTFGLQWRISAAAAFSELVVFPILLRSSAAASLRNSLDFARKAIFEMGSSFQNAAISDVYRIVYRFPDALCRNAPPLS